MSDPNYPIKPDIRPEVKVLIRGLAHPRSNIAAIHFDGPGLVQVLDVYRDNPEAGRYNPANSLTPWRG